MGLIDNIMKEEEKATPNVGTGMGGGLINKIVPQATDVPSVDDNMSWLNVLSQAVQNTPGSGVQYAKDLITPVLHPVDTAKAMGGLMKGREVDLSSLAGMDVGGQQISPESVQPKTQVADQMVDFMKERYGSIDNLKQTIAKDPVGVLGDISSILIPGGKGIRAAGIATKSRPVQAAGRAVSKAGQMMEPTTALKKLPSLYPTTKGYLGAMKFPGVKGDPKMSAVHKKIRMAETGIEYRVIPRVEKGITKLFNGLEQFSDKIDDLDRKIGEVIAKPTREGVLINAEELLSGFGELKESARFGGKPTTAYKQIRNIEKQFEDTWSTVQKIDGEKVRVWKDLTPQEVQKIKVKIYKDLKASYNSLVEQPASVNAQKTIAKQAKDILQSVAPEVKKLNKAYGPMKEFEEAFTKAMSQRLMNRDFSGIGLYIKTTAGTGLGAAAGSLVGSPQIGATIGGMTGLALGVMDIPTVKAAMSIMFDRMQRAGKLAPGRKAEILNKINAIAPTATAGAFQAGRIQRMSEEEGY